MKQCTFALALCLSSIACNSQPLFRLYAKSVYDYKYLGYPTFGKMTDSFRYWYSDRRPGDINVFSGNERIKCDESIYYKRTGVDWVPISRGIQIFDAKDTLLESHGFNWTNNNWDSTGHEYYRYSGNGDTVQLVFFQPKTGLPINRFTTAYDAGGRTVLKLTEKWNNAVSSFENVTRLSYTYNNNGLITEDKSEGWDANSGTWENGSHSLYYYTGTDLSTIIYQIWKTNWLDNVRWTYGYKAGLIDSNLEEIWNDQAQRWEQQDVFKFHYNNLGLADTIIEILNYTQIRSRSFSTFNASNNLLSSVYQGYDSTFGWKNNSKTNYTYDSYGNVIQYDDETWSGWDWYHERDNFLERYYYETYFAKGIDKVPGNAAEITLYPVPANDMINVLATWKQPQSFTVSIIDMQGRVMQQWNEANCDNYSKTIPTSGLPAGSYTLKLIGEKGGAVKQFVVR